MEMQITVSKDELLARMQENRDRHRQVFLAALDGYRAHALAALEEQARALRAGKQPEIRLILARPEDHTRDYDRVIGMLKMHQGDTFTLDERTYAQYVDDDWDWKHQWLRLSSAYAEGSTLANYGYQQER